MVEQPSPSSKASLSAGDYLGPYRIVSLLDEGGMGVVYRAHDPRLGRDVALKIMRWLSATPEQVARFGREARAAGALNHPNIVAVYDVGLEGGMPFVVTELLEGETLRDRLRRGPLPLRRAVEFGVQIAQALDAAHRKTIWHRDVKPANVFVTSDTRVKLLDFGIAKLSEPDHAHANDDTTEASQTGGMHGTPGYMSPEQVRGEPVDQRTDIFSLGSVLYEMFTGKRAFHRDTPLETMNDVLHADPVDPLTLNPNLPPVAAAVVRHCLEKNRDDRFQTARDLAFQLQQLNEPTGPVPRPAPVRRLRWRQLWLVASMLVGGVGAAFLLSRFAPPSPKFTRLTFNNGRIGGARFTAERAGVIYSLASQGRELEVFRLNFADSPASGSLGYGLGTGILAVRAGAIALLLKPHFLQGERFAGTLGLASSGSTPREQGENIESADWSASGELAVVRSTGAMGGPSWIEYPQGHPIVTTSEIISVMRISPNGQSIAYLEDHGGRGPNGAICIVDRSGQARHLTRSWKSARGLAWSPDGKEIWFTAADDENQNRTLRAVTPEGRERLVYDGLGGLTLWDIAPDGRVLLTLDEERRAVMAMAPGENAERDVSVLDQSGVVAISRDGRTILGGDRGEIFLRGTDGTSLQPYPFEGFADDLAADGKTLLATTENERTLVVWPYGASAPQPLPPGGIVQYGGAYWFPDETPRRVLVNDSEKVQSYVQDVPDGQPRPVTPEGSYAVAISPDGKWIAGVGKGGKIPLWPVDGGDQKFITGVLDGERPVAWSKDGWIWLFRRGEIPANIYRVDLTGRREPWKAIKPPDTTGVYSILDFAVTPDGKAYAYSYSRVLSVLYLGEGLK
ncbi:MAG TPA: WD40 repeat domain-containing serine/threonine protein kinase [Vicinamibacterales bacterium]|nr:WD40 repeat domain-containing serine/threonine protein kinase [Vicinamibacterales bacterium]